MGRSGAVPEGTPVVLIAIRALPCPATGYSVPAGLGRCCRTGEPPRNPNRILLQYGVRIRLRLFRPCGTGETLQNGRASKKPEQDSLAQYGVRIRLRLFRPCGTGETRRTGEPPGNPNRILLPNTACVSDYRLPLPAGVGATQNPMPPARSIERLFSPLIRALPCPATGHCAVEGLIREVCNSPEGTGQSVARHGSAGRHDGETPVPLGTAHWLHRSSGSIPCFFRSSASSVAKSRFLWCSRWLRM